MTEQIFTIVQNSSAVVGIIAAIGFILVLCVKPLREKFTEYIILKNNEDQQLAQIKELQSEVSDLTTQVKQLEQQVVVLSTALASCKSLLVTLQTHVDTEYGLTPICDSAPTTDTHIIN